MREDDDNPIVALAVADIHLSHDAPVARSAEPDWYAAMARPLRELYQLASRLDVPVIIAGDFFDDGWRGNKCPPQLINFAMRHMPVGIVGLPGQHDLIHHRYEDRGKTAYWVLVQSKTILDLAPDLPLEIESKGMTMRLHAFPWGTPVKPLKAPHDLLLEIAVIHDYVWAGGYGYQGAPVEKRLSKRGGQFEGYDIAITGDNHIAFNKRSGNCHVHNCGAFINRKQDERGQPSSVGLIHADGTVKRHYLDTSRDRWSDAEEVVQAAPPEGVGEEFARDLADLQVTSINFQEAMRRFFDKYGTDPEVRESVTKAMERGKRK